MARRSEFSWMNSRSLRRDLPPWQRGPDVARGLDLLLVPLLGLMLLVRVLTDDRSAPDSRHSGSLNLSAAIAVLFMAVAIGLLLRRRHGLRFAILAGVWICIWTAIAVNTSGASTETLREGVRESSVIAVALIAYNARGTITIPTATRMIQVIGLVPALLALYQLATHTGLDVAHNLRANGTFAHPNSAAMFFAVATIASLWRCLDAGRRRSDALLIALFVAALVATFSIDGLATLVAMLLAFSALHPRPFSIKLVPCAIAGIAVIAFFASPLGAQRVAGESSTSLAAAERGETTSSLDTRLYRWKTLLPQWERSPVFGQGLGTTTTAESTSTNRLNFLLPHNEYIRYLVETGVVGVIILIASLTILVLNLVRKQKLFGVLDADTFNTSALAITIIVGCLVNSLADNTLLNSPTCYAAVLIVAAVMALPSAEASRAPISQTA
jgi:O-antigen ligase